MQNAEAPMRRRTALAEHPFGTLKCRAGYRHFLLRGFHKVRGEWSLMALCYNFTRVLTITGLDGFIAYLAKRQAETALSPFGAVGCSTPRQSLPNRIASGNRWGNRLARPDSISTGSNAILAQSLRSIRATRLRGSDSRWECRVDCSYTSLPTRASSRFHALAP